MTMPQIDVAAWIGAIGGLSGFVSLGFTAWWRIRDRQREEHARVRIVSVTDASYGLYFRINYEAAATHEGLRVAVQVLGGGARGPFVNMRSTGLYDPQKGYVEPPDPSGKSRRVEVELGRFSSDPAHVFSQSFSLTGVPPPSKAKLRVTVRGSASQRVLARQVLYIAARG